MDLPADKNLLHLYLLIGQSNMEGRAPKDEESRRAHPRVLCFDQHQQWAPAVDPLHWAMLKLDPSRQGVGPGKEFGQVMAEHDPSATIGLIPSAQGNTALAEWEKGTRLYQQAVNRSLAAMRVGTLKGILWLQGENDARNADAAASYGRRLTRMIADLRADMEAPAVPFIVGELAPWARGTTLYNPALFEPALFDTVNDVLRQVDQSVPHSACIGTTGLSHIGDGHYDAASSRQIGRRFAAAMIRMADAQPHPAGKTND